VLTNESALLLLERREGVAAATGDETAGDLSTGAAFFFGARQAKPIPGS